MENNQFGSYLYTHFFTIHIYNTYRQTMDMIEISNELILYIEIIFHPSAGKYGGAEEATPGLGDSSEEHAAAPPRLLQC